MKSDRPFWLGYFTALALLAFMLAGCAGSPAPATPLPAAAYPNVAPGDADWNMAQPPGTNGAWDEYDFAGYTGSTFDPVTGLITVNPLTITVTQQERQTNLAYHMPLDASQAATARVQTNAGVVAAAVDPSLAYTLVERQAVTAIGEAANVGAALIDPPEPYITVAPVAGEMFDTVSNVTQSDGVQFKFTTRYRTIAIDALFDGYEHATVTTLTENPGDQGNNEMAYVWVFSGGKIVEEIIGWVASDFTIKNGAMLRWVGAGHN
jgi:hypothetical protein